MSKQMWIFLVSCNKSVDYQPVVAPNFMVDAKMSGMLLRWISIDNDLTGKLRHNLVSQSGLGKLTIIYRIVLAKNEQVQYQDGVGRPILWVEGIVVKGHVPQKQISINVLEKAFENVEKEYQAFWEGHTATKKSNPINITDIVSSKNGNKPKFILVIGLATFCILLIPILGFLLIVFLLGLPLGITLPPFGLVLFLLLVDIVFSITSIKIAISEYNNL